MVQNPNLIKDGDYYYIFSADYQVLSSDEKPLQAGIQVRRSSDLVDWEWFGYALDDVPGPAYEWTKATTLLASAVTKIGKTYYLYYSAAREENQSFIGVATSPSIAGPWHDQGEVFKSKLGDESNATHPRITWDHQGQPWLVYGSCFGGIYISRINPDNGKLLKYGSGNLIARRHIHVDGALGAPDIVYNATYKKYYLFVSFDLLGKNYNVRVGRSDSITGPYEDACGNLFTDVEHYPQYDIGNKILGSYSFSRDAGWIGTGHSSILKDGTDYFMAHHAHSGKDRSWSYLHIRKVIWTDDGWPVVSPERFAGEEGQQLVGEEIKGIWEVILLDRANNLQLKSIEVEICMNEECKFDPVNQTFQVTFNGNFLSGVYDLKLFPAWDWEKDLPCLVFTGIDQQGVCLWGKKVF